MLVCFPSLFRRVLAIQLGFAEFCYRAVGLVLSRKIWRSAKYFLATRRRIRGYRAHHSLPISNTSRMSPFSTPENNLRPRKLDLAKRRFFANFSIFESPCKSQDHLQNRKVTHQNVRQSTPDNISGPQAHTSTLKIFKIFIRENPY